MLDAQGRLHRPNMPPRSAAGQEGVARLQAGVRVNKYGRQGKPHETVVRLSQDESELSWEKKRGVQRAASFGRARSRSIAGAAGDKARVIEVAGLVAVLVGRESGVFKRRAGATGADAKEHLCLSLLLPAALPAPPSATDTGAPAEAAERETLDLEFLSAEDFGYCLAALRSLRQEADARRSAPAPSPGQVELPLPTVPPHQTHSATPAPGTNPFDAAGSGAAGFCAVSHPSNPFGSAHTSSSGNPFGSPACGNGAPSTQPPTAPLPSCQPVNPFGDGPPQSGVQSTNPFGDASPLGAHGTERPPLVGFPPDAGNNPFQTATAPPGGVSGMSTALPAAEFGGGPMGAASGDLLGGANSDPFGMDPFNTQFGSLNPFGGATIDTPFGTPPAGFGAPMDAAPSGLGSLAGGFGDSATSAAQSRAMRALHKLFAAEVSTAWAWTPPLSDPALPCAALRCPALPCATLRCAVLPCAALPCAALPPRRQTPCPPSPPHPRRPTSTTPPLPLHLPRTC